MQLPIHQARWSSLHRDMKRTKGKISLFIGTDRGLEVLKALIADNRTIASVLILVQQKHELNNVTNEIASICKKNKILHEFSSKIHPVDYPSYLHKIRPDVVFLVGWRFLVPNICLSVPRRGFIVAHDTLLPKYRGIATTTWPLINGEKETGLSLIYAAEQMDAGDIIDQITIPIRPTDTGKTMNDKYLKLIPGMILKNIDAILLGTNERTPQDETKATYGCKRIPDDGKIDFKKTTTEILRLIKALTYPYPGAFCYYQNRKIIIWDAEIVKNPVTYTGRIPGRIIGIRKQGSVDVLTGNSIIRITSIANESQPAKFLMPNTIFRSIAGTLT